MCYNYYEVKAMEEEQKDELQEPEKEAYVPRPAWQVWGARVALVLFIIVMILYYVKIMRGGL